MRRRSGAWRVLGVAALGLAGGFLAALVLQDLIGVALVEDGGEVPLGVGLLLAALLPGSCTLGVVVALLVDRRSRRVSPDGP